MVKAVEISAQGAQRHRSGRPIDLVHLARQTLGDSHLEAEILVMFDQIARDYLQRLRGEPGADETLRDLHALKGAALGVGAISIATLARDAECEARENGFLSIEALSDLELAVEEAGTFISGLLVDGELAS